MLGLSLLNNLKACLNTEALWSEQTVGLVPMGLQFRISEALIPGFPYGAGWGRGRHPAAHWPRTVLEAGSQLCLKDLLGFSPAQKGRTT